jgi:hypothetical protein
MTDKTELNPIMDLIINKFKEKYPEYTIGDYDETGDEIETPAIFIQMANFEQADNPINDFFRVKATFRAYICESYKGISKRNVRDTALSASKFINKNDWGADGIFNKAVFNYAAEDEFNEKITSAEVWLVEWEQQLYIVN